MKIVEYSCPVCTKMHKTDATKRQQQGKDPIIVHCPDLDRRYRLSSFFIDSTRATYHNEHLKSQQQPYTEHLKSVFGTDNFDSKFERWLNIDYPALGLIDEYPEKITQIINTYSCGNFYPAVTSACCLAERILNRLILKIKDYYKSSPYYKKIYRKSSFDDWSKMIQILSDWELISKKAIDAFNELLPIRHSSIHYNENYNFENVALKVINNLITAITEVFGVMNRKDIYLVFNIPGEIWVKSEAEDNPFVKEFVLPHCYYAHAVHELDRSNNKIIERLGKTGKLTDQEFIEIRNSNK